MSHPLNCSFCGAVVDPKQATIFPGPDASICSACVGSALQSILDRRVAPSSQNASLPNAKPARCSFCRKPASKRKWMLSRNDHHICDQCLVFCVDIALESEKPLPGVVSR